eukprot:6188541-Pleurochrysis_carterae.AAC.1
MNRLIDGVSIRTLAYTCTGSAFLLGAGYCAKGFVKGEGDPSDSEAVIIWIGLGLQGAERCFSGSAGRGEGRRGRVPRHVAWICRSDNSDPCIIRERTTDHRSSGGGGGLGPHHRRGGATYREKSCARAMAAAPHGAGGRGLAARDPVQPARAPAAIAMGAWPRTLLDPSASARRGARDERAAQGPGRDADLGSQRRTDADERVGLHLRPRPRPSAEGVRDDVHKDVHPALTPDRDAARAGSQDGEQGGGRAQRLARPHLALEQVVAGEEHRGRPADLRQRHARAHARLLHGQHQRWPAGTAAAAAAAAAASAAAAILVLAAVAAAAVMVVVAVA